MVSELNTAWRARWRQLLLACLAMTITNGVWAGDRWTTTGGVSQVEGSGGGGLSPWALISGYGTRDQVGGSAFASHLYTRSGFRLSSAGAALGWATGWNCRPPPWISAWAHGAGSVDQRRRARRQMADCRRRSV